MTLNFAIQNRQVIYNIYNSASRSVFERQLWKICDYIVDVYFESMASEQIALSDEDAAVIK